MNQEMDPFTMQGHLPLPCDTDRRSLRNTPNPSTATVHSTAVSIAHRSNNSLGLALAGEVVSAVFVCCSEAEIKAGWGSGSRPQAGIISQQRAPKSAFLTTVFCYQEEDKGGAIFTESRLCCGPAAWCLPNIHEALASSSTLANFIFPQPCFALSVLII